MDLPASGYRELFEAASDALVVASPTGRIHACNPRFCELAGRDRESLVGSDLTALVSARGTDRGVTAALERPPSAPVEWVVRTDDGAVPVEGHLSTLRMDGDERVRIRVTDVSERLERERDLERKSRAMDEAPIGIVITDPDREDNPVIYANEGFRRLTGYAVDDVVGRNCRFLQGQDTAPEPVDELRSAIDAEEPVTVELRNYRRDGTEFWNRVTVAPVRDDDGAVTNFVGFQEDVTERKRFEQQLRHSHHLLETIPSGIFRTDPTPDGTFEYANPALVSLLGAESAAQLRDSRVADRYVDPDEREELMEALRESDGRVKREVELETFDGEVKEVMITASLSVDETGTEHVHKVVQDITERKVRERALERYERLVENLPAGVFQTRSDPDSEFRFVNDAMVEMFGAESKAHLRNHSVRDLCVDATEWEAFRERLVARGVVTERELRLETLDGAELWGAVTAIARDVDGTTVYDGVVQDITERKQYERRVEDQRDDLDVLNRMLRHDIRNDLQMVTAYADFLTDHVDDDGREYVETIQDRADHVVELTRTARDMADVMLSTDESRHGVGLRNSLEGELDEIRSEHLDAAITVEGTIPDVSVVADDMLDSVFRNLLTNAIQHNDEEIPKVRVSAVERDDDVVVRIADNGPGVPDEQKAEIFGKGEKGLESDGTGIGLYLVESLVETYGGEVRVEDNDPTGSVFVVELPTA
ncbi:MAG: PAS domain S-box protein [Haloferacaceae archaeon]